MAKKAAKRPARKIAAMSARTRARARSPHRKTIRTDVDPFTPPQFEVVGWDRDDEGVVTAVELEWTYPTGERVRSSFAFGIWSIMPAAYEAELDAQAAQMTRDAMNGVEPRTWTIFHPQRRSSE